MTKTKKTAKTVKGGMLIARMVEPGTVFCVTSKVGHVIRALPYRRQGAAVSVVEAMPGVFCDEVGQWIVVGQAA